MLGGALVVTLVWCGLYVCFSREGLPDEPWHVGLMHRFAANPFAWPETMPHPPGYHWLVLAVTLGAPTLTAARLVTGTLACVALAAFAFAWRRVHGCVEGVGAATFSVAVLPILQPYTAMAYTDVPALAFLLCAWWAQVAERRCVAAVLLAAAVLIRQTAIVWGVFFILWEGLQAWRGGMRGSVLLSAVVRKSWWLLLLQLAIGGVIVIAGRFTPGSQPANALQPNIATLHFAAALIALLAAPLWVAGLRGAWADLCAGPRRSWLFAAVAVSAAAVFGWSYTNGHIWNRDLWLPGTSYTLLRNWPLVTLERVPWLRLVSGLLIVMMTAATVRLVAAEQFRAELGAVLLMGALLLASNNLVEPRYFITPAVFVLFFLQPQAKRARRLCLWFALLSAAHAPFVMAAKSLW